MELAFEWKIVIFTSTELKSALKLNPRWEHVNQSELAVTNF